MAIIDLIRENDNALPTEDLLLLENTFDVRDFGKAWAEFDRGDLMLWIACMAGVETKSVVLASCDYADMFVKEFVPDGEQRPAAALQAARDYVDGLATKERVSEATSGAMAAAREHEASFPACRTCAFSGDVAWQAVADNPRLDAAKNRALAAHSARYFSVWAARTGPDKLTPADADTQNARLATLADCVRDHITADDVERAIVEAADVAVVGR